MICTVPAAQTRILLPEWGALALIILDTLFLQTTLPVTLKGGVNQQIARVAFGSIGIALDIAQRVIQGGDAFTLAAKGFILLGYGRLQTRDRLAVRRYTRLNTSYAIIQRRQCRPL